VLLLVILALARYCTPHADYWPIVGVERMGWARQVEQAVAVALVAEEVEAGREAVVAAA
jgi:hypothetical protein